MRTKTYTKEDFIRLKNEAESFKLGFDDIADLIIISDKDGVILYANKVVEVKTGFAKEDVVGKTPGELWGNQMDEDFYKQMWHVISVEKKPFVGTVKNKRRNGPTYFAELRIYPILDSNKEIKFFIAIEPDVTNREEFLSLVSHQLKSPLAIERLILEDLVDESSPEQQNKIKNLIESNKELSELISNLLIISRIKKMEIKPEIKSFSLKEIVEKIINGLRPIIEAKKLKVSLDCREEIEIKTSYVILRQIFGNIITNAINYNIDNGSVYINLEKTNKSLLFTCKDDGIGIPANDQKNIFDYFFRAANAAKIKSGTGLGLHIAKLLTDIIGGEIWFESEENRGTTFFVSIPIHKEASSIKIESGKEFDMGGFSQE